MDNLILNSLDIHKFESYELLLEVLPLLEEATQRLGSPIATKTWLLTPISPGGKEPIDYLETRQYSIFCGFLLRQRTGQEVFRPLVPSKRVYRELSRAQVENARERLKPRAWIDEDDIGVFGMDGEEV